MKALVLLWTLIIAITVNCNAATFELYDPGTEEIVQYEKYGEILNPNTPKYKYKITDKEGLSKAVGEGIYPNNKSIYSDPEFNKLYKKRKLEGSSWEFVNTNNPQRDFYKWASDAKENEGVRMFFMAGALEKAGHYLHAIKAYYALIIHFPGAECWSAEGTFVWYVAPVAVGSIKRICKEHPELGLKLVDVEVEIDSKNDNDVSNDVVIVNPGRFIKVDPKSFSKTVDLNKFEIVKRVGSDEHQLVEYSNGHWQFLVNNKPFVIKGLAYNNTRIGQSPGDGTLEDWMFYDYNKNNKIDGPYDSWVDKNRNNKQDKDEPVVGDWKLLKDMGCNTIRLYNHATNKDLLRDLYKNYGIRVIMGDMFGMYGIGSGASWSEGTDYGNPKHKINMLESVKKMVRDFKDEPYILMWVLGNENNYGVANNYKDNPDQYYKFANEAAKIIKQIDPTRPVAISNGGTGDIKLIGKLCPDIDIFGVNVYLGRNFAGLWETVKEKTGKPCAILEFGCPAYHSKGLDIGEETQAEYLMSNWEDIKNNLGGKGEGNALGGVLFQWMDEWWKTGDDVRDGKYYSPHKHDTARVGAGPFPDGWGYSEWFGIVGQGNGKETPFLRDLRKAYFSLKEEWNK